MIPFIVLGILGILFLFYMLLPNIRHRNWDVAIKKNTAQKKVLLSFDDGPNPIYTPMLLDVLAQNQISACFFVVAKNAKAHPEIIARAQREGHMICSHGYAHQSAWLSSPNYTKKDFEKAKEIFDGLGIQVKFFRPPWGTFNLKTQKHAQKMGLQTMLWSINAKDWAAKTTAQDIEHRLLKDLKEGDIICLHDNGGAVGAPGRTIQALKAALPQLKERGFEFIHPEELL